MKAVALKAIRRECLSCSISARCAGGVVLQKFETARAYSHGVPRRQPRPLKDFAFDFIAGGRPYAASLPGSPSADGWQLSGTVTEDGRTYGVAICAGLFAACTPHGLIFELTTLENSCVALTIEFRQQPGWEKVPKCKRNYYGLAMTVSFEWVGKPSLGNHRTVFVTIVDRDWLEVEGRWAD